MKRPLIRPVSEINYNYNYNYLICDIFCCNISLQKIINLQIIQLSWYLHINCYLDCIVHIQIIHLLNRRKKTRILNHYETNFVHKSELENSVDTWIDRVYNHPQPLPVCRQLHHLHHFHLNHFIAKNAPWRPSWISDRVEKTSGFIVINLFSILEGFNALVQKAFALGPKKWEKCLIHKQNNSGKFSKFFFVRNDLKWPLICGGGGGGGGAPLKPIYPPSVDIIMDKRWW